MRAFPLLLSLAATLLAQDFAHRWKTLNDEARATTGLRREQALREMNELAPGNARLLLSLAAVLDPGLEALQLRQRVADAGIILDPIPAGAIGSVVARNKLPVSNASVAATLPGSDWITEDLVAIEQGFLVSSVRQGIIMRTDGTIFAKEDLSVFGLALDKRRQWVWAALGWSTFCKVCSPRDKGKGALVAYDLNTGAVRTRIDSFELNDLTVSSSGDVYVTSNAGGALFVLPAEASKMERIDTPGELPSPQGPALSRDEKTLYLADYRRGIATINLRTKQFKWLKPDRSVMVNGIDGLYVAAGSLLAVQNGVNPVRILQLSRDLKRQRILEANWAGLGEPTHLTVIGKRFCFLANTGWDAFQEDGSRKPNQPPVVSKIYCRPLP